MIYYIVKEGNISTQNVLRAVANRILSSHKECGYDDCNKTAVDIVLHEYPHAQYVLLVCKKHLEWERVKVLPPPTNPWGLTM